MTPKQQNFKVFQLIIEKFIKSEKISSAEKSFWPREIKILKSLVTEHGLELFQNIKLGFKLNSMAFFKTEEGMAFILQYKTDLKNQSKQKTISEILTSKAPFVKLEKEKVSEDKVVSTNKKMIEFLDLDF